MKRIRKLIRYLEYVAKVDCALQSCTTYSQLGEQQKALYWARYYFRLIALIKK